MKRLIIFNLTLILISSCSGQDKENEYNPRAIELNNKAVELMTMQKYDSALMLLDKATEVDKNYHLGYANKVTIYCELKDYKKALIEAEKQLKAKPDLAEGWAFAGMLYDRQGDTIKAKEYYAKSIEIFDSRISNPDKKEQITANRLNRAFSLILLGQEQKGKEEMRKLKEENPDDLMIEEFLKMNKQDYLNQLFENE